MSRVPDAIVVGGGIVGACCALELARRGLAVEVLERTWVGSGTTSHCEGNILAWDKEPTVELPLALRSAELWARLAADLEDPFEYETKGSVVMAEDEAELAAAVAQASELAPLGVESHVLDAAGLREEEPAAAEDLPGGVLYPADAQVEPRLAARAVMAAAEGMGVAVHTGALVTRLRHDDRGRATGVVMADGSERPAGIVVAAAGVWTGPLLQETGIHVPVQGRKGQIVVAEGIPAGGRFARKLNEAGYLSAIEEADPGVQIAMVVESTASGTLLLGSSRELVSDVNDAASDTRVAGAIAARALRFFPVLGGVRAIRIYAGLRPFAPDHLPIVGAAAEAPGLLVATGHEGAGIGLAPATGELIAALATGTDPAVDPAGLSPVRFAGAAS